MVTTLIMFIMFITSHRNCINTYILFQKFNPISIVYSVGRMGCWMYGVWDVWGVGRKGVGHTIFTYTTTAD